LQAIGRHPETVGAILAHLLSTVHMSGEARRAVSIYSRRKWLLLAIIVLIPAAAFAISKLIPKTYQATTTLVVRSTSVGPSIFANSLSLSVAGGEDAVRLVDTTPVAAAAAKELGEPPTEARALLGHVKATLDDTGTNTSSDFMTITTTAATPQRAADLANAFALGLTATRTNDAQGEIEQTIEQIKKQSKDLSTSDDQTAQDELASQLQQLQGLRASQENATIILEKAEPPSAPISPKPLRNALLALVLALLIAAGIAPALEAIDRRIRTEEDLEDALGVPNLASIPDDAFPGHPPSPASREAFQTLRAALTYFNVDKQLKIVLVCSPAHGEGKTTVATNLAAAMAQDGTDVILLDGDLRKPQVSARLMVDDSLGIEQILVDHPNLGEAFGEVQMSGSGRLRVIASHLPSATPSVLLGSKRMRELLDEMAMDADVVVIDTPPLLAVSDAVPLIREASGVVLVAKSDATSRDGLLKARQMIEAAHGTLLGSVLTGVSESLLGRYGGYGYYSYDYAAPDGDESANAGAKAKSTRA